MPFLLLKDVSVRDVNGEGRLHKQGAVVSDWEVEDRVKAKIKEGSLHFRTLFEPLTEEQALAHRSKETVLEGDHLVDGQWISPPWPDYVGLHPEEVVERMRRSQNTNEVEQVRLYERGGQGRRLILDYVAPVERPPLHDYDDLPVRTVLEKLEILSDEAVQEVITYEFAHRKRPAIISFERPSDEASGEEDVENQTSEEVVLT